MPGILKRGSAFTTKNEGMPGRNNNSFVKERSVGNMPEDAVMMSEKVKNASPSGQYMDHRSFVPIRFYNYSIDSRGRYSYTPSRKRKILSEADNKRLPLSIGETSLMSPEKPKTGNASRRLHPMGGEFHYSMSY